MTFRQELREQVYQKALRRATNPKKAIEILKRKFKRKAKNAPKHVDSDYKIHVSLFCGLTEAGYFEIKKFCEDNEIRILTHCWSSPFPKHYEFYMRIL